MFFILVCVLLFVQHCDYSPSYPAPPPPSFVTSRQNSRLKSLKIKTLMAPIKSIKRLCPQCQTA